MIVFIKKNRYGTLRVNDESMVHCIRAAEVTGINPLIGVQQNDPGLFRQSVEAGAQRVVVLHVKSAAETKKALEAIFYPPEGSIRAANFSQDG